MTRLFISDSDPYLTHLDAEILCVGKTDGCFFEHWKLPEDIASEGHS